MRTVCLRLPMVYGPGHKGHLPRMIARSSGACSRRCLSTPGNAAFVHVEDAVDAAILVAQRPEAAGKVYIVSEPRAVLLARDLRDRAAGARAAGAGWHVPRAVLASTALAGDLGERITRRRLPFDSAALSKLSATGDLQRGEDRARARLQDQEELRDGGARPGCPAQSFVITAFAVAAVLAFAVAAGTAWLVARNAARLGLLDVPNERSSHVSTTPRGGGIGICRGRGCGRHLPERHRDTARSEPRRSPGGGWRARSARRDRRSPLDPRLAIAWRSRWWWLWSWSR